MRIQGTQRCENVSVETTKKCERSEESNFVCLCLGVQELEAQLHVSPVQVNMFLGDNKIQTTTRDRFAVKTAT